MTSKLLKKPHQGASRIPPESTQYITLDKIKSLLPAKTNIAVTEEIVSLINNMEEDTGLPQELLEEDLMSYTHILGGMKGVGMKDLVNAIKFCNLKRNYDNQESWAIVFPDKHNRLIELNKPVANHVSMYNNSKLVVAIDKEMLIPVHLQYAPYFHAAVKKQFELMNGKSNTKDKHGNTDKVSPMVQHLAAKELAVLTKQPEEQKLAISINPGEVAISMQQEMNDQLKAIVAGQKKRLEAGESIIDVQEIGLDFSEVGRDEQYKEEPEEV